MEFIALAFTSDLMSKNKKLTERIVALEEKTNKNEE